MNAEAKKLTPGERLTIVMDSAVEDGWLTGNECGAIFASLGLISVCDGRAGLAVDEFSRQHEIPLREIARAFRGPMGEEGTT